MADKRVQLSLDDDEIELEELIDSRQSFKTSPEQTKRLAEASQKHGFTSREPTKKRRKVSPYTAQFGGKCREGMKQLFQEIGDRMKTYDTETLELAILALIEKEKLNDLKKAYNNILTK